MLVDQENARSNQEKRGLSSEPGGVQLDGALQGSHETEFRSQLSSLSPGATGVDRGDPSPKKKRKTRGKVQGPESAQTAPQRVLRSRLAAPVPRDEVPTAPELQEQLTEDPGTEQGEARRSARQAELSARRPDDPKVSSGKTTSKRKAETLADPEEEEPPQSPERKRPKRTSAAPKNDKAQEKAGSGGGKSKSNPATPKGDRKGGGQKPVPKSNPRRAGKK